MSNVKNVEAFGKLTGICTGYGGSYKPGKPNLEVSAMATLFNEARQSLDDVHAAKTDFNNATNTREEKFNDMQRLCPRIVNALKANGASALTVQDAQASVRRMQGKRRTAVVAVADKANEASPKKRIARGLDFSSMADHFAKLVETVSSEPSYEPKEAELTVANLTTLLIGLHNLNNAVNASSASVASARRNREAVLYSQRNNLVSTAKAVKQYIRSAYGLRSTQDAEVSKIKFH
jgi:hypothetical protein